MSAPIGLSELAFGGLWRMAQRCVNFCTYTFLSQVQFCRRQQGNVRVTGDSGKVNSCMCITKWPSYRQMSELTPVTVNLDRMLGGKFGELVGPLDPTRKGAK